MSTSWTRSAFEAVSTRTGASPVGVGLGLFLAGAALFGLQELLLGRAAALRIEEVRGDAIVAVVHIAILVYLLTAYVIAARTSERTFEALAPLLEAPRPTRDLASDRRTVNVVSVVGVMVGAVIAETLSPGVVTWDPRVWTSEIAVHRVIGFLLGFWVARLFGLLVVISGRLSQLAGALPEIDLLDLSPLGPFARQGLTNALLVVGVVSAFSLFLVDLAYLGIVGAILAGTLVVAVVALLLPLRGLRDRIAQAKGEELAWVRERIRGARTALSGAGEGTEHTRLDELIAWEARVEAVRDWPVDTSTWLRFLLYLLIPLGSWAGGALVERAIDALLD